MFHAKNLCRVAALIFLCSLANSFAAETPLRFVTWKSETAQMWDQPIADFEKQNPGVKVIREIGPQSSTQLHDLITQKLKNRDTEMDVFVMDVIWPAEFASAGWALPMDRFFALAEQKQFLDAPIRANRYRGEISASPFSLTQDCSTTGRISWRNIAYHHRGPGRNWSKGQKRFWLRRKIPSSSASQANSNNTRDLSAI